MAKKINWKELRKAYEIQDQREKEKVAQQKRDEFNSFLTESGDYLQKEIKAYDSADFNTFSRANNAFQSGVDSWRGRSNAARSYVSSLKDTVSEEEYKSYLDVLNRFDAELRNLADQYKGRSDYYSQFTDKDEEKAFQFETKYDGADLGMVDRNIAAGDISEEEREWLKKNRLYFASEKELSDLISEKKTAMEKYTSGGFGVYDKSKADPAVENFKNTIAEMEMLLGNKEKERKRTEKLQSLTSTAKADPDFLKKSEYIAQTGEGEFNTRFVDQVNNYAPEVYTPAGGYGFIPTVPDTDTVNEYGFRREKALEMSEEEKRLYTYFFNEEEFGRVPPGTAEEYLKAIELDKRATEKRKKELKEFAKEDPVGSSLASVILSPLEIPTTLMDVASGLAGKEINENDYYHQIARSTSAAREGVSEDMSDFGSFLYNTGMSMLDTGYNMVLGGGSGLTTALMSIGAAGDAIIAAKDRGVSDGKAVMTGLLAGAAEAVFEKFSLGNLKAMSSNGGAGLKNFLKNWLKQAGVEASEEAATELSNIMSDYLINRSESDYGQRIKGYMDSGLTYEEAARKAATDGAMQVLEAAAAGALSGGVFGLGGTTVGAVNNYTVGRDLIKGKQVKQTADLASTFDADTLTAKRLAEMQKKTAKTGKESASYAGALYQAMAQDSFEKLSEAKRSNIEESVGKKLAEKGLNTDEKTVRAVAKKIFGKIYGAEKLTTSENKITSREEYSKAVDELASDAELFTAFSESESIKEAEGTVAKLEEIAAKSEANGEIAKIVDRMKVSADGADLQNVTVENNGDVYITDAEGKKTLASDAELTEDAATAVAYTDGMSHAKKRAFLSQYAESGNGIPLDDFHLAFDYAYTKGLSGAGVDEAVEYAGPTLTEQGAFAAFKKGLEARGEIKAEKDAEIKSFQKTLGIEREGGKVDDKAIRYAELAPNDPRRAVVSFVKVVAQTTGRNFVFFQSTAAEQESGKENGRYEPETNTIYIDINAGIDETQRILVDQVLPTVSHELVHIFAVEDPEGFKTLSDLVFAGLKESTGHTRSYLISEEINRILEKDPNRFEGKSEETRRALAEEEIVARACEDRLANSSLMKKFIEEMENKESGLAQKFSNFLGEAIARLKKIFQQIAAKLSYSKEAQSLRKLTDQLEAIQSQYDALLERRTTEATTAPSEEQKNTSDRGVMSANRVTEEVSVEIDEKTKSASPMLSERTWNDSEYVQKRREAAEAIAEALGVSKKKAFAYVDAVNGIAKMIADDRTRLDYEASSFGSAFVSNVEYGGSFDHTTLCPKRRLYTGTFSEIQKQMPDDALTADEILIIRNLMLARGLEATCGLCYVEGSRAEMGKFSKEFIKLYKRDHPDAAWYPNMVDVNTPDGVEKMRINHPDVYDEYEYFWNHYGKLKESDPALFASQQKPKLYEARKEYKGEILKFFSKDETVTAKNKNGGIRIQSFSDFEMVHMIDTMQILMDMSRVKLAGQAYTKIPAFADAFGNTGLKINLSLIAKDVDENGNLIFDDREGMPHDTAFSLRDKYSKNVGTILVIFNDKQLVAAMADPRVDFIIPFHRSQWKKRQYGAMGLPANTKDYTYQQNEKLIKQTYHEWRGKMVKDKAKNYMPNEYWDFTKSGKENAEEYLRMCAENNKRPKFYKLLENNGDGSYSLKSDGSTDGYWKLLIDFKMYDNKGKGSPQMPVRPDFSMDEIYRSMEAYEGGHESYPVAYDVVDEFMATKKGTMKADRGTMKSDRATYDSAREMLLAAAEEAEKEKIGKRPNPRHKYLAEYKNRVETLDRKYANLEKAEAEYLEAMDSGKEELAEKIYKRIEQKTREINRLERDLQAQEKSKELVRAYNEQVNLWREARHEYENIPRPKKPNSLEFNLAEMIRREKDETRAQALKEGREITREKLGDYRQSIERKSVREQIDVKVRRMFKKLEENKRKSHIPDDLKQPLRRFLKSITEMFAEATPVEQSAQMDFVREARRAMQDLRNAVYNNSQEPIEKPSEANSKTKGAHYSGLLTIDKQILEEMDELVKYLDDLNETEKTYALDEMDLDSLKQLNKILAHVSKSINSIDKAFAGQGKETISSLASSSMEYMRKVSDFEKQKAKKNKEERKIYGTSEESRKISDFAKNIENAKDSLKNLISWEQMTPYTAFSQFGEGGRTIYGNILRGWGDYAFFAKQILDFSEKTWTAKEAKEWSEEIHTYELADQEFDATVAQIMYLYVLNRREQGKLHLNGEGASGGFVIPKLKTNNNKKAEAEDLTAIRSTAAQREAFFEKHLTDRQRKVAENMQRFLSDVCGAWGNDLAYKLYGYRAFTDPNYMPIVVNQYQLTASAGDFEGGLYRLLNMGFTKPLNPNANNSIFAVDIFEVFAAHAADMAKYRSLALPVMDAIRWMNYSPIIEYDDGTSEKDPYNMQTAMKEAYGDEAIQYVKNFLKDLNGSNGDKVNSMEALAASLTRAYKTAAVGANLKVVALQPTSYLRALAVLDRSSLIKAFSYMESEDEKGKGDGKKAKKAFDQATQNSGMALWKSLGYYDVGIGRTLTDQIKQYESLYDKALDLSMKLAAKADEATLGVLFKACQIQLIDSGKAAGLSREELLKAAGELLDEVIVRTQVVDSTVTRSQLMRSKSKFTKNLTAFMSEPTVAYNLILQGVFDMQHDLRRGMSFKKALQNNRRTLKKNFAAYAATALAAAAVETLFAALRRREDEDEEAFLDGILNGILENSKTFVGKILENANPITMIPMIGDLFEKAWNTLTGKQNYSDNMEYEGIAAVWETVASVAKLFKEGGFTAAKLFSTIDDGTKAASYLTGLPIANAIREVKTVWNNTIGEWFDVMWDMQAPSASSAIEKAFKKGDLRDTVDGLINQKYLELQEERPNVSSSELRDRAKSSVKSTATAFFKKRYLDALEKDNRKKMDEIRTAMRQTGLYDHANQTAFEWEEAYREDRREKGLD